MYLLIPSGAGPAPGPAPCARPSLLGHSDGRPPGPSDGRRRGPHHEGLDMLYIYFIFIYT